MQTVTILTFLFIMPVAERLAAKSCRDRAVVPAPGEGWRA